jgi:hypothetical protein
METPHRPTLNTETSSTTKKCKPHSPCKNQSRKYPGNIRKFVIVKTMHKLGDYCLNIRSICGQSLAVELPMLQI